MTKKLSIHPETGNPDLTLCQIETTPEENLIPKTELVYIKISDQLKLKHSTQHFTLIFLVFFYRYIRLGESKSLHENLYNQFYPPSFWTLFCNQELYQANSGREINYIQRINLIEILCLFLALRNAMTTSRILSKPETRILASRQRENSGSTEMFGIELENLIARNRRREQITQPLPADTSYPITNSVNMPPPPSYSRSVARDRPTVVEPSAN